MASSAAMALAVFIMVAVVAQAAVVKENDSFRVGFYKETCPRAEEIIKRVFVDHVRRSPTLAAPMLRMLFHDCFVRGCDASVLLNSTKTMQSEKESVPNRTLRGFQIINAAKEELERECPGVVSCADVLAVGTRDAVVAIGGPKWDVPTGRRDGLVSLKSEVASNLASPFDTMSAMKVMFEKKGLELADLVTLSGAHTVGTSSCTFVTPRLFDNTTFDPRYADNLRAKCSTSNNTGVVELDPGSYKTFDNHYFVNVLKRRALFFSDSALLSEPASRALVRRAASSNEWFLRHFAHSVKKLSAVDILTGNEGNIRRHCALLN